MYKGQTIAKEREEVMAKITSERVAGPDDPIYTGRWVLSPMSAPKKSKKENTKDKTKGKPTSKS